MRYRFWADFSTTKGAIKLHVGLNHSGYLPEFVTLTEGKTAEITIGRTFSFPIYLLDYSQLHMGNHL